MVSPITARLVSNQRAAFSSTATKPTVPMNMKHHRMRKPHTSSATKRSAKHRQVNPFSSVECHRRERAEMNYRAATTDEALAKAGRPSCSSSAPTSALPIGIDLSLVQVVPSRDHDALHSPSPSNDAESTPIVSADDDGNSLDPVCYGMDFYSGLLSSTRRHYDFEGTGTSPTTSDDSQPEPADSDPSADRRRGPGFKTTHCEVLASMMRRSTSESTWTASLPTMNHKTAKSLDSDNASDTSSSGVSSNDSVVNSEDEMSRTEKPPFGEYLEVAG